MDHTYRGVDIVDTWPTATKMPGAIRPGDRERYMAVLSDAPRLAVYGGSLREIRAEITRALAASA
jgi:hypothetical protein